MPRGSPSYRAVLTALLAIFLLFLQQENARHALSHIGAQLERVKHSALELPSGEICIECAMLAAGTAAMPGALPPQPSATVVWIDIVARPTVAAIAVPSFYQSRAPPHSLQLA